MTEKLLEAEKKKLTQLELQLDEEIRCGKSSVEKVRINYCQWCNYWNDLTLPLLNYQVLT